MSAEPRTASEPELVTLPDDDSADSADGSDDDLIDSGARGTFRERMWAAIGLLRDLADGLADGLEYQVQFNDLRILTTVERNAAGALRLARHIQDKERQFHSTAGAAPRTWDASTIDIMSYRPRP